jgi:predicted nucleic acid-binding protein
LTLYVDASALLKRYISEPDTRGAQALLLSDPDLTTARHTFVEVRRSLARHLSGTELAAAKRLFDGDWALLAVVELAEAVCWTAAELAESTGVRTLDALHLAAALHAGGGTFPFVTYDARQGQAARALGWTVLGI